LTLTAPVTNDQFHYISPTLNTFVSGIPLINKGTGQADIQSSESLKHLRLCTLKNGLRQFTAQLVGIDVAAVTQTFCTVVLTISPPVAPADITLQEIYKTAVGQQAIAAHN